MINSKEEIVKILSDTYEQEKSVAVKGADKYYGLSLKLIQTTEQFARSFEYELPKEHNLKGKAKRFIQKVIRKLARFLTKPYAEQMLKFQESMCELAGDIIREIEEDNNNNEALLMRLNGNLYNMFGTYRKEIAECRKEIAECRNEIAECSNEIAECRNEIAKCRNEISECRYEIDRYRKDYEEQLDIIRKLEDRLYNSESTNEAYGKTLGEHEEAIYKLTSSYNDTANLVLDINNHLFKGNDVAVKSYSQAGEDVIVAYILKIFGQKTGYSYLDIGCNRYNELNNTYYFYKKGVRGVLIDANPKFIKEIQENRPEDIVLNVGIGIKSGEKLIFYVMNGDGLSSFNKENIAAAMKETSWLKVEQEIEVPMLSMNDIYEKYFYGTPSIVSIDIEGDELSILKSIDMKKYRPLVYIIETIEYREKLDLNNKRMDIIDFMQSVGYKEYAFTGINSIFIDCTAV